MRAILFWTLFPISVLLLVAICVLDFLLWVPIALLEKCEGRPVPTPLFTKVFRGT